MPYTKRMRGLVIPAITPMTADGKVDVESTANFCEFLVNHNADCLYPNGTNGESLMLTADERRVVAETMVNTNNHRIAAFIQCGSMTTAETVAHAIHSVEIGADGIGVMSPAFFPMDEEMLFLYYSAVMDAVPADFPVYIYNIPSRTANDVTPNVVRRLCDKYQNIVGIKYSSGDLMRIEDYLMCVDRDIDVLIGCDSLFFQCLMTGGKGTVSGPGSIFIERFTRLYKYYNEGNYAAAMEEQRKINETDRRLAPVPGIPALKTLLMLRGVIKTDVCREPLRKLTKDEYKLLETEFNNYMKEENLSE